MKSNKVSVWEIFSLNTFFIVRIWPNSHEKMNLCLTNIFKICAILTDI